MAGVKHCYFNDLPTELQRRILALLSFDATSRAREVCKKFNQLCQQQLNAGFRNAELRQRQLMHRVKIQLPRRESERRHHPLARHSDVLTAVETRLSLLSMTFKKYIDLGVCCFIPGKVLDEVFGVLRLVRMGLNQPAGKQELKPHEILQELRDISSMAMEHFDEKIRARLDSSSSTTTFRLPSTSCVLSMANPYSQITDALSASASVSAFVPPPPPPPDRLTRVEAKVRAMTEELNRCKGALQEAKKVASQYRKQLAEQARVIAEQGHKIEAIDRKLLEYDARMVELMAADLAAASPSTSLVGTKRKASPVAAVEVAVSGAPLKKLKLNLPKDELTLKGKEMRNRNKLVAKASLDEMEVLRKSARLRAKQPVHK